MNDQVQQLLRQIPSVDRLLASDRAQAWVADYPRSIVIDALRHTTQSIREHILSTKGNGRMTTEAILDAAEIQLKQALKPSLRRVINATGIALHTGLGRAPLSRAAIDAIVEAAGGYCNLEFDLETGGRGRRVDHVNQLLCRITGAEAATVVNNCAAATFMILNTMAQGREVVVSRGQLVEIGGSYRLPDIMAVSGAKLKEVGTTNRTRMRDYRHAITDDTAALMRVHTSNYRVTGFTEETSLAELVALGILRGLPLIDDLGSGIMSAADRDAFQGEPLVQASVAAGADVVCFSGDKLLGGPQCGVIVGKIEIIRKIEQNALMRTYRVDKLTLAALEATLAAYLDPETVAEQIPTLAMLTADLGDIERRALALAAALKDDWSGVDLGVVEDHSYAGGGALPTEKLRTWIVTAKSHDGNAEALAKKLRTCDRPIVTRIKNDMVVFDCRTISDQDIQHIHHVVQQLGS